MRPRSFAKARSRRSLRAGSPPGGLVNGTRYRADRPFRAKVPFTRTLGGVRGGFL